VRPLFPVVLFCLSFAGVASAQAPLCDVTCDFSVFFPPNLESADVQPFAD
jgi:hypothetical protein